MVDQFPRRGDGDYFERIRPAWDELAQLLRRAKRRGPRRLTTEELTRLDQLYRLCTVHLAQTQARRANPALTQNLNRLVAQVHSFIYVSPRPNPLRQVVLFYLNGFARAVARTGRFHLAALVLFLVSMAFAYHAAMQSSVAAYALSFRGDVRLPGSSKEQLEDVLRLGRDLGEGEKFVFASALLTHNTKVGLSAFALGVLCGVPTVFLIVTNGAMMGAFAAVHVGKGVGKEMWAWILPHGITEIGAIILCGGAGLMLGMAVLRPRHGARRDSLVAAGREALRLVMGVLPMFVAAGVIESYVRQSCLETRARFLFALGTALFWAVYFTFGFYVEHIDRISRRLPARSEASSLSGEAGGATTL
jgi:uncharacterized membrane protein SpoIIM required for sporulation